MLELVRLVGELQAKVETAVMWQARAEVLAERLAAAESKIAALAAPQEPEIGTPEPSTAEQTPEPSTEPSEPESPWWKRWLAAVSGW